VSKLFGALRVAAFVPDVRETTLDRRGFGPTGAAQQQTLETVGRSFLTGLRVGLEAPPTAEIERRLDLLDEQVRGFAYEGAAMGVAIADGLSFRGTRTREFLEGPGRIHPYMTHVGIGWAYARLPKSRWRAVPVTDPLLRWLVLDGLGFHQAYFHTEKWVGEQYRPDGYPAWPGVHPYLHRAVDQGIGRALWFVFGAEPHRVAAGIEAFSEERRSDLWSGAGLASTYAGGVDADGLAAFWELAGPYRPEVAQGAAFAAKTRLLPGLVVPHTELAVRTYCGSTVEEAARVTDEDRVGLPPNERRPAYEIWRQRIQDRYRPAVQSADQPLAASSAAG
jgi:hypothetical protein